MFILSSSGKAAYGLQKLLVDTKAELATIDIDDMTVGSQTFVVEESKWYILNSKKEWVKMAGLSDVATSGDINDLTQVEDAEFYGGSSVDVMGK